MTNTLDQFQWLEHVVCVDDGELERRELMFFATDDEAHLRCEEMIAAGEKATVLVNSPFALTPIYRAEARKGES